MGEVIERITLVNTYDEGNLRHGYIKQTEVRKMEAHTLVDTGATNKETLLCVIPLEQMYLRANVAEQKLEGARSAEWARYVR